MLHRNQGMLLFSIITLLVFKGQCSSQNTDSTTVTESYQARITVTIPMLSDSPVSITSINDSTSTTGFKETAELSTITITETATQSSANTIEATTVIASSSDSAEDITTTAASTIEDYTTSYEESNEVTTALSVIATSTSETDLVTSDANTNLSTQGIYYLYSVRYYIPYAIN